MVVANGIVFSTTFWKLYFFITMYVVGVKFETNLFSKAKMEPEKNLHLQHDRVNLNFGAIHLNIISEMLQ